VEEDVQQLPLIILDLEVGPVVMSMLLLLHLLELILMRLELLDLEDLLEPVELLEEQVDQE
jgi:hypothetical protein